MNENSANLTEFSISLIIFGEIIQYLVVEGEELEENLRKFVEYDYYLI